MSILTAEDNKEIVDSIMFPEFDIKAPWFPETVPYIGRSAEAIQSEADKLLADIRSGAYDNEDEKSSDDAGIKVEVLEPEDVNLPAVKPTGKVIDATVVEATVKNEKRSKVFVEHDDEVARCAAGFNGKGNKRITELGTAAIAYGLGLISSRDLIERCKSDDDKAVVNKFCTITNGATVNFGSYKSDITLYMSQVEAVANHAVTFFIKENLINKNDGRIAKIKSGISKKYEELKKNMNSPKVNNTSDDKSMFTTKPEEVTKLFDYEKLNAPVEVGGSMTATEVSDLEKIYGEILQNKKHSYFKLPSGLYNMTVQADPNVAPATYIIDSGSCSGYKYAILLNFTNAGSCFVSPDLKDIIKKCLDNASYAPTEDEFKLVSSGFIGDARVYSTIDLKNWDSMILPKLKSSKEVNTMSKILTHIVYDLPWNSEGLPAARLRFNSFTSLEDFDLVSDNKCTSPMNTLQVIADGLKIRVKAANVITSYQSIENTFPIYGVRK